jgi:hypothetical protein
MALNFNLVAAKDPLNLVVILGGWILGGQRAVFTTIYFLCNLQIGPVS